MRIHGKQIGKIDFYSNIVLESVKYDLCRVRDREIIEVLKDAKQTLELIISLAGSVKIKMQIAKNKNNQLKHNDNA